MDVVEEYICDSYTDSQNLREWFDTEEDALAYAKNPENSIDFIVHVNYEDNTEELIWEKGDEE